MRSMCSARRVSSCSPRHLLCCSTCCCSWDTLASVPLCMACSCRNWCSNWEIRESIALVSMATSPSCLVSFRMILLSKEASNLSSCMAVGDTWELGCCLAGCPEFGAGPFLQGSSCSQGSADCKWSMVFLDAMMANGSGLACGLASWTRATKTSPCCKA